MEHPHRHESPSPRQNGEKVAGRPDEGATLRHHSMFVNRLSPFIHHPGNPPIRVPHPPWGLGRRSFRPLQPLAFVIRTHPALTDMPLVGRARSPVAPVGNRPYRRLVTCFPWPIRAHGTIPTQLMRVSFRPFCQNPFVICHASRIPRFSFATAPRHAIVPPHTVCRPRKISHDHHPAIPPEAARCRPRLFAVPRPSGRRANQLLHLLRPVEQRFSELELGDI